GSCIVLLSAESVHARGGGGGFRGGGGGGYRGGGGDRGGDFGGGGYRGGGDFGGASRGGGFDTGGYRGGGAEGGGYRGGEASGFHASGGEASGFHASDASVSGFHASGGDVSGFHASGVSAGGYSGFHGGLPTDGAFGGNWTRAGGAGAIAHATTSWSGSVASARGAAVRNGFGDYGAFGHGWYGDHSGAWAAAGWGAGAAWRAATWPAIGAWCGWGSDVAPVVYDYGNNVTYQGDQVYYGTQPVATADQYYQQASDIAQSAPAPDPQSADWLPLGVFALVQGDQSDTNTMFQLAVNKSGAIAGNYNSVLTGSTAQVHGAVDKQTQRAAWTVGDNKTTVYDAGISNLSKDEAPVLIHLGKDKTQQWMLVRLKQTDQQNTGN
ncbi:MAG TPA: protocadherin, partial [Pirellulales bacterium]|nr:protocadherin [Pirellulales bacterium]